MCMLHGCFLWGLQEFLLIVPQFGLCMQVNGLELLFIGEFVVHRYDPQKCKEYFSHKHLARYMHGNRC